MPRINPREPMHQCQCNCGGWTARNFMPGHDQRHRGNLQRAAARGDSNALLELTMRGWYASGHSRRAAAPTPVVTYSGAPRWGAEIEFLTTVSPDALAAEMNRRGVRTVAESYNHTTRSYWKIVHDGSCGWELVSPPLSGDEGMRQLQVACEAMAALNVQVNRTCGLHIHHDATQMDLDTYKNTITLYASAQDAISSTLPESRRNATYAYPYNSTELARVRTALDIRSMGHVLGRYKVVNTQSYARHQTVEFRQHSGTTEYDKIRHWIAFGQALIRYAADTSEGVQHGAFPTSVPMGSPTLQDILDTLVNHAELPQDTADYMLGRAVHFTNQERTRQARAQRRMAAVI